MKKPILVVSVVFVLFLLGCAQSGTGIGGVSLKDCGNDASCFDSASQNCAPAKATLTQSTDQGSVETYAESRGISGSECEFYSKINKFDIATDVPGVSADFSAKVKTLVKGLEGKDMVCRVPQDIAKSQTLDFAESQDLFDKYCSGALKDELSSLQDNLSALVQEELQNQIAQGGLDTIGSTDSGTDGAMPDAGATDTVPVGETGGPAQ